MSRRICFFILFAFAPLIATPAAADPACFGESCRPAAREPVRLARAVKEPGPAQVTSPRRAHRGRSVRVSSPDPGYVVGHQAPPVGEIGVLLPGYFDGFHGFWRAPVYVIAPSAKIISIDRDY